MENEDFGAIPVFSVLDLLFYVVVFGSDASQTTAIPQRACFRPFYLQSTQASVMVYINK